MKGQPCPAALVRLDIDLNRIDDEGIIALANSPLVANLRSLSIGSNRFGDEACRALAESPHLNNLEILIMTDNPGTTSTGRVPLWRRFDRPGCKFVFGFRKRAEDEQGAPEPKQTGHGFKDR